MKKLFLYLKVVGTALLILNLFSCDEQEQYYYDNTPPSPPTNVQTVTGDGKIDITWNDNYERDLDGYNVYYSYSYDGEYTLIGSTSENYFVDYDAVNGETYYYAVTAYDYNDNESELSYDVVYDTPRPEGFNQAIFDYLGFETISGYSFANYSVVPYNDDEVDFFFENYDGTYYINVWDDTDIQDMGRTTDIYDIKEAPVSGWVPLVEGENVKYVEAKVGNTYIIWTWDNHFAKIRIKQITSQRMVFDWTYQLVEGNRMLKRANAASERSALPLEVVKK